MEKRIILASSSRYRAKLLRQAGIPFETMTPEGDEVLVQDIPLEEAVLRIALQKMESVAAKADPAIVIASDQLLASDDAILGKPGNPEVAVRNLLEMAGKTHRLITALVVKDGYGGHIYSHVDVHEITFRNLSEIEVEHYVRLDRPLDCAGSFRIESLGIWLIERICGQDYTAIVGLPMLALIDMLRKCGITLLNVKENSGKGTAED